jgi:hypothetical protein
MRTVTIANDLAASIAFCVDVKCATVAHLIDSSDATLPVRVTKIAAERDGLGNEDTSLSRVINT